MYKLYLIALERALQKLPRVYLYTSKRSKYSTIQFDISIWHNADFYNTDMQKQSLAHFFMYRFLQAWYDIWPLFYIPQFSVCVHPICLYLLKNIIYHNFLNCLKIEFIIIPLSAITYILDIPYFIVSAIIVSYPVVQSFSNAHRKKHLKCS